MDQELQSDDLISLIKSMQRSNENMFKQINVNHETLSKDIKESSKNIKDKIANMTKNFEAMKDDIVKTDDKNASRLKNLEDRIVTLENVADTPKRKRSEDECSAGEKNKVLNKSLHDKSAQDNLEDLMKKVKLDEKRKNQDRKKQEKAAEVAAARRAEKEDTPEKVTKKKKIKLGDSQDLHDAEDWAWDE